MRKMIDYRTGRFQVSIFAACGNFVQILDVKGHEVARVIQAFEESQEALKARTQALCDALNITYREACETRS